jgi:shikimate kinase
VVVWLSVPAQLLAERAVRKRHRPLVGSADDVALFERQLATREPLALPLAALVIDETSVSEDEAADRIVRLVDSGTAAPPSPPP